MAAEIRVKRGPQSRVAALDLKVGEFALATDTGNVYIKTDTELKHLNPTGGTAESAEKLASARNFSITGDGTASAVPFDGTGNVQLALALAAQPGLTAGTYSKLTVNAKGVVTAAAQITIDDIGGLGTAAKKDTGTAVGNVVIVGTDGKIDERLIPAITLTKSDVGLGNVDNTADADKSVKSADTLTTARSIAIAGGATGGATNFNGSSNITIQVTALDASKLNGEIDGGTF